MICVVCAVQGPVPCEPLSDVSSCNYLPPRVLLLLRALGASGSEWGGVTPG